MANNTAVAFDETLQSSATATGNGTAMAVGGLSGVGLQVTGTFSLVITPEASADGSNYVALGNVVNLTTMAVSTTITAAGLYWVPLSGMDLFRARVSSYTSGSVTVVGKGVLGASPIQVAALQSSGTLGTVAQGTAASASGCWPVRLTDGTNSQLTGTLAALSATDSINSAMVVQPGQWAINHVPAAATQATISRAAAAGDRHVITGFSASLRNDAAAAGVAIIQVRDGATGAGTVLQSFTLAVPAVAGSCTVFGQSGLNIVGSVNTAATIESTASGGANTYISVNLQGYTISA